MDASVEEARSWSAAEQGRAIAAGRLDPVALAEAYLDAIGRHPAGHLVYTRLTPARARAEAEAARARAREGRSLGPLDGVCVVWKDLFDTAGVPTEAGSRLLAARMPAEDAEVVRRATAQGAVCLGKTQMSELAFSGLGVNPMAATPPNRHGAHLAPGGSSSGAAAALAFDLAPLAIGSDTGGSVRIPAAWNDLVGLKTTAGLVPLEGCVPLSPRLDTVGPLARSVEDAALGLALLTGEAAPAIDGVEPGDVALFVPSTEVMDVLERPIDDGFGQALDRLGAAGIAVGHGAFDGLAETVRIARERSMLVNRDAWDLWGARLDANRDVVFAPVEARIRAGAAIDPGVDAEVEAAFARLGAEAAAWIGTHGLIAMPTVACPPPPVAPLLADTELYHERNAKALRNTRLANLLGLSAITLPTGTPWTGLMLLGPPRGEAGLLAAARAVERVLAA